MRQKHLESILSSVKREFESPDITLEQYPTSPHLTAATILAAGEDVGPGRTVLDLGCGTGMLAIACAVLDSDMVIAIDCDRQALDIAQENAKELEVDDRVVFLQARVATRAEETRKDRKQGTSNRHATRAGGHSKKKKQQAAPATTTPLPDCAAGFPLSANCVDTVLTNPPFGTKHNNQGMDIQFLLLACRLATRAVYAFHKTSTRAFVLKTVTAHTGCPAQVVAEMKFDLPNSYKFHKNKSVDVEVDLIRVDVSQKRENNKDNGVETACLEDESAAVNDEDEDNGAPSI